MSTTITRATSSTACPSPPSHEPGRQPVARGARRGGLVLAGLLALGAVTGCEAAPPVQGTVTDKEHTKRHDELQYTTGCGMELNGKYSCGTPASRRVTEPEAWTLTVEDATGQSHEVHVSRQEYKAYPVGSSFVEATA